MPEVIEGADRAVAQWVWDTHKIRPITLDKAIGILDKEKNLVGAILLSNFNGSNVEFGYYGRNTFSPALLRWCAQRALSMGITRATILTSKKHKLLLRFLPKLGAHLEGVCRRYYGTEDCPRNTAVRFVLFQEDFSRIAFNRPLQRAAESVNADPPPATAIR